MSAEEQDPIIALVWRPADSCPPVMQMAQRTGSRAIFDCSTMEAEALPAFLQRVDPAGQVRDIKISTLALMNPSVERILGESGIQSLWVECDSYSRPADSSAILSQLKVLSQTYRCFPIVGDVPLLAAMVRDGLEIGRIVLKGCEASGFVGSETILVLYSTAKDMLRTSAKPLDIVIWGGVWTPEAAAALLVTGAAGIVFESVHWLTDLVATDDLVLFARKKPLKLRIVKDERYTAELPLQYCPSIGALPYIEYEHSAVA